jgi:hypothetical protein
VVITITVPPSDMSGIQEHLEVLQNNATEHLELAGHINQFLMENNIHDVTVGVAGFSAPWFGVATEYSGAMAAAPEQACPAGKFKSANSAHCITSTICHDSEFESSAPNSTVDRQCSQYTVCRAGTQFESTLPSATSDRVCKNATACNTTSQYESKAPTATADRLCADLTQCDNTTQFDAAPPSAFADRSCARLTDCAAGECETAPPSATTDRICEPHVAAGTTCLDTADTCTCTTAALQNPAPVGGSSDVLQYWNECPEGTWQTSGNIFTGADGQPLSTAPECRASPTRCAHGTFAAPAAEASANGTPELECAPWDLCGADFYISQVGNNTSDRVCLPYTKCNYGTQFMSQQPTIYQDRVCSPLSTCPEQSYESNYGARGEMDDRNCTEYELTEALYSPLSGNLACENAEYQIQAAVQYGPHATAPKCAAYTICATLGSAATPVSNYWSTVPSISCPSTRPREYQAVPATPTDDRICASTTPSCGIGRYMSASWTYSSDLECANVTACTPPLVEIAPATPCADRVCGEPAAPTPSTPAPTPAPVPVCPAGMYDEDADGICDSCTDSCPEHQQLTGICSDTTNPTCT